MYQSQETLFLKEKQIKFLSQEISYDSINKQLEQIVIKEKIIALEKQFQKEICSDVPNAFWDRKQHIVQLPYIEGFNENMIPTKARPIQMNKIYMELCKTEIQGLLAKQLIRKSSSCWSCAAFYVNKNAKRERGIPRLVINHKPLNKVLQWIRYPIPNKKDLLKRLKDARIFSKFDLKSGYWQVQIAEQDKTAFTIPFGHGMLWMFV